MNFFWLYLVALGSAGGISYFTLPRWRSWCLQKGLVDDPGHRKIHALPVPLAGGLAVFTGLALPLCLGLVCLSLPLEWFTNEHLLVYAVGRREGQLLLLFLGALAVLMVGFLDDKIELRPALKFFGQFIAALLVALADVRITLFVQSSLFSYAITIFWVLAVINAFNFMDNMNGLCAGLGAIGAWGFALSAALQGQYLVTILAAVACGALVGFLPHNFPQATAFLGDAGSHLVGYWLAVLAILPNFYNPSHPDVWAVFSPLLILAVPLGDMVWVVLLRWRMGKPFYIGDNNHLSHRLVRHGYSRSTAVLIIWLLAVLTGSMALFI